MNTNLKVQLTDGKNLDEIIDATATYIADLTTAFHERLAELNKSEKPAHFRAYYETILDVQEIMHAFNIVEPVEAEVALQMHNRTVAR